MLVTDTLSYVYSNYDTYILCLLLSILIIVSINYCFFGQYLIGLLFLQMSFIFNSAIIFFGAAVNLISLSSVVHFFFYEMLVIVGSYSIFYKILKDRKTIIAMLERSPSGVIAIIIIIFNIVMLGIYYVNVPIDGSSRIEFMTGRWFSFVRPIDSILQPLGYFLAIYFLDKKKYLLFWILLSSLVLTNISSGSKASFVFSIFGSFLLYQQIKGEKIKISPWISVSLLLILSFVAKMTLDRLSVDLFDVLTRFIRTAEATIIVYFSDNPTEACTDVSKFAAVHRGIARLFSDSSAMNIDTLFGYALSIIDYGDHNFTGPNSQISSYMLCNFAGVYNVLAVILIIIFFVIVRQFYLLFIITNQDNFVVYLLPFVIATLDVFPQSYDSGSSSLSVIAIILFISIIVRLIYGTTNKSAIDNNISS